MFFYVQNKSDFIDDSRFCFGGRGITDIWFRKFGNTWIRVYGGLPPWTGDDLLLKQRTVRAAVNGRLVPVRSGALVFFLLCAIIKSC